MALYQSHIRTLSLPLGILEHSAHFKLWGAATVLKITQIFLSFDQHNWTARQVNWSWLNSSDGQDCVHLPPASSHGFVSLSSPEVAFYKNLHSLYFNLSDTHTDLVLSLLRWPWDEKLSLLSIKRGRKKTKKRVKERSLLLIEGITLVPTAWHNSQLTSTLIPHPLIEQPCVQLIS